MNVEAVPECNFLARLDGVIAGSGRLFLEIVQAKWIRREQAVVAHVPGGWMPQVGRMIKNRNADRFVIDRSVVVDPFGVLAPGSVVTNTLAVHDVTVANFSFETHGF